MFDIISVLYVQKTFTPPAWQHKGDKPFKHSRNNTFSQICVCVLVVHIVLCFSDLLFHLNTKQACDTFSIVLSCWHAILHLDLSAAFNYIHPLWFFTDSDFSQCFHQTSAYPWRKNFIQFHFLRIMKCIALPSLTNLDTKENNRKTFMAFWKFHRFRHIRLHNGSFFTVRLF